MLETFGKIFKVIRESKKMSLKEVAAGDISVAQLSRFERGVNGITLDSFYCCLKNMAVSLEEFQYVYHNYIDSDDVLFSKKVADAYQENNVVKLQNILSINSIRSLSELFCLPVAQIFRLARRI